MKVSKQLLLGTCIFALSVLFAPGAKANPWDQKVVATFSGPVEIPGQVLPPGTYALKIMNIVGVRDVIQVTTADESKVLATAFAIDRYRMDPTDKPVFLLEERGSDAPQALKAWYYPGYRNGHEFVYRTAARTLAASNLTTAAPVPAPAPSPEPTNETTSSSYTAPVESSTANSDDAITSQPEPAVLAQNSQNTDQSQVNQTPTTSTTPDTSTDQTKELPKTASSTPLIALIGLLSLGGAIGLKILAARVS